MYIDIYVEKIEFHKWMVEFPMMKIKDKKLNTLCNN